MDEIRGEYLGHNDRVGFVYCYTCSVCNRRFTNTAPSISEPSICETCFHGDSSPSLIRAHKSRRRGKPVEE